MTPAARHRATRCLLALLLASCGQPADRNDDTLRPRIDTLANGVVAITHPDHADRHRTPTWRFVETHRIDPPDTAVAALGRLSSMVFDRHGTLYVMQQQPVRILVFDSTGHYRRTIGREGDGPGEIVHGTLGVLGDTLLVHQGWGSRLTWFALDGTPLGAARSPAVGRWSDDPTITDTLHRTWLPGAGVGTPRPTSIGMVRGPGWVLMGPDGVARDSIAFPSDPDLSTPKIWRGTVGIDGQAAAASLPIPLQTTRRSSPRHDGLIISGRTDQHQWVVSRRGSDTLRLITFPLPHRPLTTPGRQRILARTIPEDSPFARVARAEDLPEFLPRWTHLTVDSEDRLWIAVPGEEGEVQDFLLLDRDGLFLGWVPAPHPQATRGVWGSGWLAVPDEDSEGRSIIRVYRLQRQ